jgi:hypothetical protein
MRGRIMIVFVPKYNKLNERSIFVTLLISAMLP